MAKQTIEIDCPDGTIPVFDKDTQKIEFVVVHPYEKIKTVKDAIDELYSDDIQWVPSDAMIDSLDLPENSIPYGKLVNDLNLLRFIELQTVLKAVNGKDYKWSLTEGEVWYPWVKAYSNFSSTNLSPGEHIIGHFVYNDIQYTLIGGPADYGAHAGLLYLYADSGAGIAYADIGILSCKDKQTAAYVSSTFGRLVFEAITAFKVDDIKWLD